MRPRIAALSLWMVAGLVATSLPPAQLPAARGGPTRAGGTLRVGMGLEFGYAMDPQKEIFFGEIFRCCLLRTLLSYNGRPASEGGADLAPDLASGMPTVSPDGLMWTFRLKR